MIRTILAKERILNLKEKFQVIMRNFLKDIIAFSNSTGGKVIVGIEDETGTVYGIGEQSPFKLSDSISNMVSDACTPQIEPDISIQTIEEKTVTCHRYCSWKVQTLLYCEKRKRDYSFYSN
mgnify:CR=1 FL=1